ncbi:Imm74 family immunity protein [Burkholderia anthina]|uniref:Imm74 family immunity protein n=1 Tax=Burkholderia anthina TaxID=179879 RepID=UPI001FC879E4|nr:Imm74 family immunity protein [Burkholderia anthina]
MTTESSEAKRLTYQVLMISRGEIVLSDGARIVRVPSEALLPVIKDSHAFVVYVDSMQYLGAIRDGEKVDVATRQAVISAITAHFSAKGSTVDFES